MERLEKSTPTVTLSAEQKIYGNLNVTTAITDPGQPTVSKSIKVATANAE